MIAKTPAEEQAVMTERVLTETCAESGDLHVEAQAESDGLYVEPSVTMAEYGRKDLSGLGGLSYIQNKITGEKRVETLYADRRI